MKHVLLGEIPDRATSLYRLDLAKRNLQRYYSEDNQDVYNFWRAVRAHAEAELA